MADKIWTKGAKNLQPEKLKNVLVLHSHNASADYLSTQPTKSPMAPNLDSYAGLTGEDDVSFLHGLRSPDGIQYHHFKHKVITDNPSDGRNINPCIDTLQKYISGRDEALDAIVVTAAYGTDHQNAKTIDWLKEMKDRFPGVKVLVDGYLPRTVSVPEGLKRKTPEEYIAKEFGRNFAIPNNPDAEIDNMIKKVVITQGNPNYTLAEPIDMMPVNDSYADKADLLRKLIGMSPYKEAGVLRA